MSIRLICLLASTLIFSGCASLSAIFSNPSDGLRSGARLELHQSVVIPAESVSVYIQNGEFSSGGRNRFIPFCEIYVRKPAAFEQHIEPDSFEIRKVSSRTDLVKNSAPVKLAAISIGIGIGWGTSGLSHNDAPSDITETFLLKLHSDRQPNVRLMICGGAEDTPAYASSPTVAEIHEALGDIASLHLAGV